MLIDPLEPMPPPPHVIVSHRSETVRFHVDKADVAIRGDWNGDQLLLRVHSCSGGRHRTSRITSDDIGFWGLRHYRFRSSHTYFVTYWSASNKGQVLRIWEYRHGTLRDDGSIHEGVPDQLARGYVLARREGRWIDGPSAHDAHRLFVVRYRFRSRQGDFIPQSYRPSQRTFRSSL